MVRFAADGRVLGLQGTRGVIERPSCDRTLFIRVNDELTRDLLVKHSGSTPFSAKFTVIGALSDEERSGGGVDYLLVNGEHLWVGTDAEFPFNHLGETSLVVADGACLSLSHAKPFNSLSVLLRKGRLTRDDAPRTLNVQSLRIDLQDRSELCAQIRVLKALAVAAKDKCTGSFGVHQLSTVTQLLCCDSTINIKVEN